MPSRDNRYGTDVSWPLRLDRVPGSQVLWRASYGTAGLVAPGPAGEAAEAEKYQQVRSAVAETPGISLAKLRVALGDDGTWIRKAVAAHAIFEEKTGPGKPNRYTVNPEWSGPERSGPRPPSPCRQAAASTGSACGSRPASAPIDLAGLTLKETPYLYTGPATLFKVAFGSVGLVQVAGP